MTPSPSTLWTETKWLFRSNSLYDTDLHSM